MKKLDASNDQALRKKLDKPVSLDKKSILLSLPVEEKAGWVGQWLSTHFGPGKLSADEFLYYGLQKAAFSKEDRLRYIGKQSQNRLHNKCNQATWFATSHNKLLLHAILTGAGLAHPALQCAMLKNTGIPSKDRVPMTMEALEEFLSKQAHYPLFAKPVEGMYSIGAMHLTGYADKSVHIAGYGAVSIEELFSYMNSIDEHGYIFQQLLQPPEGWKESFGPGLTSVRVMVLLEDAGPRLHMATAKIPDGTHEADNFWREGNMLSPVNVESGRLGPAVKMDAGVVERIEIHPKTGAHMEQFSIPQWEQLCQCVLQAASLLPGIRTQGWDVAVTDSGPVLLELNFGGDLNLHQLAHGRGVLDDGFIKHLRQCGVKGKLLAA